jgi:hypothetical protein
MAAESDNSQAVSLRQYVHTVHYDHSLMPYFKPCLQRLAWFSSAYVGKILCINLHNKPVDLLNSILSSF